jgi:hypothetical protein
MSQSRSNHLAITIFCWLPPEQARLLLHRRRLDRQLPHVALRHFADGALVHEAGAGEAAHAGERDVGLHVHAHRQPEMLAVFRQVADAMRHRIGRLADHGLATVDDDLARLQRIGTEDGARHLGAAGAHQAGKAEDLALAATGS